MGTTYTIKIIKQFNNLNYNETLLNSIFDTFLIKNLETNVKMNNKIFKIPRKEDL